MKKNIIPACIILSVAILLADCQTAPPKREHIPKGNIETASMYLDSLIRSIKKEHRIPGMAVAVVHNGKVIFSRTYGTGLVKKDVPITKDTVFMAGSLTKSFTALAVTRLIREGKLSAEDEIRKFLPDFSIKSYSSQNSPITIGHLLTHTSGLPIDYYGRFIGKKKYSDDALLSRLKEEYLCFQPGTAVKYSNIGYKLLGMIVERVSGKPYEEYLKGTVLKPIGMNRSGFSQNDVGVTATGHDGDRGNRVMPMIDIGDKSSSGLFTTLGDCTSFLQFLSSKEGAPGSPVSGHDIVTSIIQNADFSIDTFYDSMNIYSTGWYLGFYDFKGIQHVLSNSGNVNGFSSELTYIPEENLGMVVLSNSSLGWKADIVIAHQGLQGYLGALGNNGNDAGSNKNRKNRTLSPPPGDITGKYAAFGFNMTIFRKRGTLRAKFRGPAARLISIGRDMYQGKVCILFACIDISRFTEYDNIRFRFYSNREGKVFLSLVPSYGNTKFYFPLHRVKKPVIPDDFKRNYGVWKLEAETEYPDILKLYLKSDEFKVFEKNGWIYMETKTWMGKGTIVLEPLSKNLARVAGSGEIISFNENELQFIGLCFKKKK